MPMSMLMPIKLFTHASIAVPLAVVPVVLLVFPVVVPVSVLDPFCSRLTSSSFCLAQRHPAPSVSRSSLLRDERHRAPVPTCADRPNQHHAMGMMTYSFLFDVKDVVTPS